MNLSFGSANRTAQNLRNINRATKRKQVLRQATLEQLELRTLLSTVDITAGLFAYGAANSASNLTVSSNGTNDTFTDSSQVITLTANATAAGWTGSGTNTVTGPESSITFMSIGGIDSAGQSVTLDFGSGGDDPLPALGLTYDPTVASTGSNSLTLEHGSFTTESYSATGAGAGTITYSDSTNSNVPITYSNLSPITDTVTSPALTFTAPTGATTVNVVDGPTVGGDQTDEINDGGTGQFELIDFANKAVATVNVNNASATTPINIPAIAVGLTTLNVNSGAGSDNVDVQAVGSGIAVNVDMGSGSGSITLVGLSSATSGILSPVAVISTGGNNTLTIDDSADAASTGATLDNLSGNSNAPFEVTGLSTGVVEYGGGIALVNVDGGTSNSSGITYTVNDTQSGTTTVLNGGGTVTLGGNTSSPLGMQGLNGTIDIGTGSGITVTLDDSQNTAAETAVLSDDGTSGTVTGLSPATINYTDADIASLTVNGGTGGNTFTVNNTAADFITTLNSGAGNDTVNVLGTGSGGLDVDGQDGSDTVTLGGADSPVGMQDLTGTINVSNDNSFTTLTLDDSEDTTGQTATLGDDGTTGTVTGLSPATITYPDAEISGLTVNGGSGGNDFTVNGTLKDVHFSDSLTTLNKGSGSNTVNVEAITANSILDLTGTGSPDTVNLGLAGSLAGIVGTLNINEAAGSTNLVIDLSTDSNPHDFDLSSDGTTSTLVDNDGNLTNPITFNTASIATLTIDGNPSEDENLTIDYNFNDSGGFDPIPSGSPGLVYNAGAPGNGISHTLTFLGELASGPFASETHTANDQSVFPAVGQYGSFAFDDGTGSPTALTSINYTGLNPLIDTAPAFNYIFNDAADDNSFTAVDGPIIGGFQTIEFQNTPESGPATFETTDIANKVNVVFNTTATPGMSGVVNIPTASDGLTTLTFNTLTNGENDVAVLATPAGIATAINGGTDQDVTNVTGSGITTGDTLVLTGGPGVDTLNFDADGLTPTLTAGGAVGEVIISLPGFGSIDATGYENVNLTDVAPVVITPGAAVLVSAVEGAATNVTVGTFTLPLAAIGITNPAGLPASDFTATIDWNDGSTSPGTIVQDATNPALYYITGMHTYGAAGDFDITDTIAFAGATYSSTLNGSTVSVTVAPAGPTAGTSATAIVAAAALSAQGTTVTGIEGNSTGSALVATFMDTGTVGLAAGYTAVINWGDGSPTTAASSISSQGTSDGVLFSVFGAHTYTDEGNYAITVTITKTASGAAAVASSQAIIADAALTAGAPVALTPHSGITIGPAVGSFTDADPISTIGDFTSIIYWGDGSNSAGTLSQPGGIGTAFIVTGTHAYATPGAYTISTHVTDDGGSTVTLTGTATVSDVPVTGAVRNFPAVEGQNTGTIMLGTFTDPNPLATAESLTATLPANGWGDGTPAAAATLTVTQIGGTATTSLFQITGSHTYADEGSFPVNITVTTSGGVATILTSGTATVADAVLSPSLGTPIVATEGAAGKSFVVGTFTDENPGATIADFTAVVTATSSSGATFTGTGVTFTALGGGAFSVSANLAFPTAGTWSISTLVTDDGGNKALLNTIADVAFAPLTPITPAPVVSTVKLSTGLVIVGTFTDPNPNPPASDFSSVIDWGDGSPTSLGTIAITPGVAGGPSTINVLGIHTYETYGHYTITVVTTEGGVQTITTTSTGIANQPHLVFVNGPITTVAGNTLPVIKVYAEDAFGNLAFQDHSTMKLEIFTGTSADGKIVGVRTAKVKDGIAQFGRIGFKIAGDYTLVAVDGRYAQAVSSIFSVTPAAPKKIAFTSLPANATASNPFGVEVQIWDKFGNLEKSDSSIVTLALGKHPHQAALSGLTSITATGGIADFTDLSVSASGIYRLVASDSELPHKQPSAMFDMH